MLHHHFSNFHVTILKLIKENTRKIAPYPCHNISKLYKAAGNDQNRKIPGFPLHIGKEKPLQKNSAGLSSVASSLTPLSTSKSSKPTPKASKSSARDPKSIMLPIGGEMVLQSDMFWSSE